MLVSAAIIVYGHGSFEAHRRRRGVCVDTRAVDYAKMAYALTLLRHQHLTARIEACFIPGSTHGDESTHIQPSSDLL